MYSSYRVLLQFHFNFPKFCAGWAPCIVALLPKLCMVEAKIATPFEQNFNKDWHNCICWPRTPPFSYVTHVPFDMSISNFQSEVHVFFSQISKSHDVTPWYLSASCNARYDHIRFAAEALKLRDKVRIPDVFGEPQDEWIWLYNENLKSEG